MYYGHLTPHFELSGGLLSKDRETVVQWKTEDDQFVSSVFSTGHQERSRIFTVTDTLLVLILSIVSLLGIMVRNQIH